MYSTELEDLRDVDGAGKPITHRGSFGLYGIIEHRVYEEVDHEQGLTLFAQVGLADARVNRFTSYYGGGLVYTGLIPAGISIKSASAWRRPVTGTASSRCSARPACPSTTPRSPSSSTYAAFLLVDPVLVLRPDVQYVINPGTNPALDHAWVIGIRIEAGVEWFK